MSQEQYLHNTSISLDQIKQSSLIECFKIGRFDVKRPISERLIGSQVLLRFSDNPDHAMCVFGIKLDLSF